jgi:hypothetical protein
MLKRLRLQAMSDDLLVGVFVEGDASVLLMVVDTRTSSKRGAIASRNVTLTIANPSTCDPEAVAGAFSFGAVVGGVGGYASDRCVTRHIHVLGSHVLQSAAAVMCSSAVGCSSRATPAAVVMCSSPAGLPSCTGSSCTLRIILQLADVRRLLPSASALTQLLSHAVPRRVPTSHAVLGICARVWMVRSSGQVVHSPYHRQQLHTQQPGRSTPNVTRNLRRRMLFTGLQRTLTGSLTRSPCLWKLAEEHC